MTTSNQKMIAHYCQKIYAKGLSPGTSGNVSLREGAFVWITPTGLSLGEVESETIVELSMEGTPLSSEGKPSSEWPMHQALYQKRKEIRAIVHAHPPYASALAACHQTLSNQMIAEGIYHLGEIPLVPYALHGTRSFAEMVAASAQEAWCLILANHGVLTLGKTIREAFYHLELLENLAQIDHIAHQLPGGPKPLSHEARQAILDLKYSKAALV